MSRSFYDEMMEAIQNEGFPSAGGIDLDSAMAGEAAPFLQALRRYDDWLARGFAGSMTYLVRGRNRRADPSQLLPDVKSVICVLAPYPVVSNLSPDGPQYSPYLFQPDYHQMISEKLNRALARFASNEIKWKICVDTSAVLEKTWAMLAGLGSFGKNTLLLNRTWGSRFCLGVVLLNQKLNRAVCESADLCGSCRRCLDACPTQALVKPGVLDASRCLCYLTLENRDEPPASMNSKVRGTRVAGCDECQRVCPHNRSQEIQPLNAKLTSWLDWDTLLQEDEASYQLRVRDSALSRVPHRQFRRNVETAYQNRKELE